MRCALPFLALTLASCTYVLPEETGAPPRPWPPTMVTIVKEVPRTELMHQAHRWGMQDDRGRPMGIGRAQQNVCRVFIVEGLDPADRQRVIAHEKRHCTGQQHEWRGDTLVWLP